MRLSRKGFGLPIVVLALAISVPNQAIALSWGPIRAITSDEQGFAWPGSTVAYQGGVAVAYRHIVGGEFGSYVRRSTDGGTTWTSPTQLNAPGTFSSRPALAAFGDTLDAVFVQSNDGQATSRVIYRTSANGGATWSSPMPLSPTGTLAGFPSVARNGLKVVVAWTDAVTGRVSVRISGTGGAGFRPRVGVATTSNQPFIDSAGDFSLEAWATVIYAGGVINLAYHTNEATLKLRRSSSNDGPWTPAITLATNVDFGEPSLAASGSTVLVGYTVEPTSTSNGHAVYRRSGNRGQSWSGPAAFSGGSARPSSTPVIAFASNRWRVAFSRCFDDFCDEDQVYYRLSIDGRSWGATSRVTGGPGTTQFPAGVTHNKGKALVVFISTDGGSASNVLVRQAS